MPSSPVPEHIAIIMDGNGRWAKSRFLPRIAGHKQGVESVRALLQYVHQYPVKVLTLFAFSSENWRRPQAEVKFLLNLFYHSLTKEVQKLHENNIRLKIIGDRSRFDHKLCHCIEHAEHLTANNSGLTLVIAVNYGGQWDLTHAMQQIGHKIADQQLTAEAITADTIAEHLSLNFTSPPDLLIRTSGESRVSNFLIWELAYCELYFTETLWPDFDRKAFEQALMWYQQRERRFGQISESLQEIS